LTLPGQVLYFNCCGDAGRVDIQTLETDDSQSPSKAELEAWKAGKLRLWACTYTFHVQEVTRKTAQLTENGAEVYFNELITK